MIHVFPGPGVLHMSVLWPLQSSHLPPPGLAPPTSPPPPLAQALIFHDPLFFFFLVFYFFPPLVWTNIGNRSNGWIAASLRPSVNGIAIEVVLGVFFPTPFTKERLKKIIFQIEKRPHDVQNAHMPTL